MKKFKEIIDTDETAVDDEELDLTVGDSIETINGLEQDISSLQRTLSEKQNRLAQLMTKRGNLESERDARVKGDKPKKPKPPRGGGITGTS